MGTALSLAGLCISAAPVLITGSKKSPGLELVVRHGYMLCCHRDTAHAFLLGSLGALRNFACVLWRV